MTIHHDEHWRVTREAAEWFMELQTTGASCHAEFAQWLRRSPEHVEEFLAITGVSRKLDGIDPERRIDIEALLKQNGAEVIRLNTLAQPPEVPSNPHPSRWVTGLLAASVLVALVIAVQWARLQPEVYVTGLGEQRAFKLPDGSLVHLNTQSRAEVRFTERTREIRLLEGEALFSVERDPLRPFRVRSGATTVQALGTEFNVYYSTGHTTVSVVEGAVQVTTDREPRPKAQQQPDGKLALASASTRLDAGERAEVRDGLIEKRALPEVESVTAWRQRRLVFRDKPLAEVVTEFNRYNTVQFDLESDAAGSELLSGVFAADRPDALVLFLEKDKSIKVERHGDRLIIREARL